MHCKYVMSLLASAMQAGSVSSQAEEAHEGEHDTGHGHHYHKNLVGLFTGVAHKDRSGTDTAYAVGLEYERRINERFGIGALAEYTGGDADFWIYAVPFAYHFGHWKFLLAPGVEDGHHGSQELFRVGAEYAFDMGGGWEIAPQLNVDFVDSDEVWVLGVVFAKGF